MTIMNESSYNLAFLASGIIFHLCITIIFFIRPRNLKRIEKNIGIIVQILFFPVLMVLIHFIIIRQDLWKIIYLILILSYLILEFCLDYVWKIEFRSNPKIHIPYVIFYFLACFGFIGVGFTMDKIGGFIVLITFFTNLGALGFLMNKTKQKKQ